VVYFSKIYRHARRLCIVNRVALDFSPSQKFAPPPCSHYLHKIKVYYFGDWPQRL